MKLKLREIAGTIDGSHGPVPFSELKIESKRSHSKASCKFTLARIGDLADVSIKISVKHDGLKFKGNHQFERLERQEPRIAHVFYRAVEEYVANTSRDEMQNYLVRHGVHLEGPLPHFHG